MNAFSESLIQPKMPTRVVWKIAAPMFGLGVLLLVLGASAAYNVNQQQLTSSEVVAREVKSILIIHDLHSVMREIRYQLNLFLRTHEPVYLNSVAAFHDDAEVLLAKALELARVGKEQELIAIVNQGYQRFFESFQQKVVELENSTEQIAKAEESGANPPANLSPQQIREFTELSDVMLTNRVLKPLQECLEESQQVVERTNQANQVTARHLKVGFLLLGTCGALAGLLLGTAMARTIGRSIVQLNISVRGVAGRLSDVTGPVTFSHTGDLAGIETGLREMERDIADVVERLQQRETELLRSEQLAQVGQLAAGMAHELRNPLMPMKMLVQSALERGDDAGLKGRALEVINEEIGRLEQSIQTFLDYARPQLPEKSLVDVREIVSGTVDLLVARAQQQRVEIRPWMPSEPVMTQVDRAQLRQLLLNLMLNALDALSSGGTIECRVEPCGTDSASTVAASNGVASVEATECFSEHDGMRAILSGAARRPPPPTDWLEIRVANDGPPIPEDSLETIFEPFVTTKETGSGLGLSVCRRIALDHGGKLTVRNRPNGGPEFTLLLPHRK